MNLLNMFIMLSIMKIYFGFWARFKYSAKTFDKHVQLDNKTTQCCCGTTNYLMCDW